MRTRPLPARAVSSQMLVSERERSPRAPEEELGAAHMHTHTDGDALKVEFTFTAIRQLEDK